VKLPGGNSGAVNPNSVNRRKRARTADKFACSNFSGAVVDTDDVFQVGKRLEP
jgi:hypothetical protein